MNKLVVKVTKTKERLYAFDRLGLFLIINHFYLLKVYLNTIYINNKIQILYISDFKLTFTDIYLKANILEIL
jgi:hypothetical protein